MKYKIHPVADMFPMLEGRPFNDLEQDIELYGQHDPIVVDGDTLIDGRNRLRACESLGIEPKVVEWSTLGIKSQVHEWIFSKNIERRHLTDDQRVAITLAVDEYTDRLYAEEQKAKTQFKPGNHAAKKKHENETVNPESGSPSRDVKAMHARSTAGRVGAKAQVSRHKAQTAINLSKLAENDTEAAEQLDEVKQGLRKLKDTKAAPKKRKLSDESIYQKCCGLIHKAFDNCPLDYLDSLRTVAKGK